VDWTYGVIQAHQSRLNPLLDALKKLRLEGLTAALVLSAVHHRRVLPLMSRPLRMDEMGPGVSSRDLEACRMSNEAQRTTKSRPGSGPQLPVTLSRSTLMASP